MLGGKGKFAEKDKMCNEVTRKQNKKCYSAYLYNIDRQKQFANLLLNTAP